MREGDPTGRSADDKECVIYFKRDILSTPAVFLLLMTKEECLLF